MKKYKVLGEASFRGYMPSQEFEAEFTDAQEARYIERGSIELADGSEYVPPAKSPEEIRTGEQPETFDQENSNPDAVDDDGYGGKE